MFDRNRVLRFRSVPSLAAMLVGCLPASTPPVCAAERTATARELSTDRPDLTESAKSVDRGLFQLESSFFLFSHDRNDGAETTTYGIAESNIKYGVTDDIDVQLVFIPYVRETVDVGGERSSVDGFGDVVLRMKYNVWGNDEGSTAFGLLPFVKVPTGTDVSNEQWEGGLVTPFQWDVSDRWGIGGQVSLDGVYDDEERRHSFGFGHTFVVGFAATESVGVYAEYAGLVSSQPYEAFFSCGATYAVTDRMQLDAATVFGLNDASADFTAYSGISWKF